jgi:hypothetical protein
VTAPQDALRDAPEPVGHPAQPRSDVDLPWADVRLWARFAWDAWDDAVREQMARAGRLPALRRATADADAERWAGREQASRRRDAVPAPLVLPKSRSWAEPQAVLERCKQAVARSAGRSVGAAEAPWRVTLVLPAQELVILQLRPLEVQAPERAQVLPPLAHPQPASRPLELFQRAERPWPQPEQGLALLPSLFPRVLPALWLLRPASQLRRPALPVLPQMLAGPLWLWPEFRLAS